MQIQYDFQQSVKEIHGQGEGEALFLHGFQQTAESLSFHLSELAKLFATVYVPDGPFPVPYRKNDRWQMGYSWYFFDRENSEYKIDMSTSVAGLHRFIENLATARLSLVGYSQGGYLSPFVAEKSSKVNHVLMINSRIRTETLVPQRSYRLDAVHGKKDVVVDNQRSRSCYEEYREKRGELHKGQWVDCESGHRIDDLLLQAMKDLVVSQWRK